MLGVGPPTGFVLTESDQINPTPFFARLVRDGLVSESSIRPPAAGGLPYISGDRWDVTVMPHLCAIGVKAAPSRRELIELVLWFRSVVDGRVPLVAVEASSGTSVPLDSDTLPERLLPVVGVEDW